MKEEILKDIDSIQEITKDYNNFKHLLSDDEGKSTLAKLHRSTQHIRMLLAMQEVKDVLHPTEPAIKKPLFGATVGSLVSIRPVAKEYDGKTFIGFYVGDIAAGSSLSVNEGKIQVEFTSHNPAIFVPSLRKVIFGYESWWAEIESEEQFKDISDADIENVWYVKLWKFMQAEAKTD